MSENTTTSGPADQPSASEVTAEIGAATEDRPQRIPATPATPPPGGPQDPAKREVRPIAHPPVTLPPNPPAPRKFGVNEIIIALTGIACLVSTWLPWFKVDYGIARTAWTTGVWPAGVLGFLAAAIHLIRMLPPADKAMGAILPLLLSTAPVWVPIALIPDNAQAYGLWICLVAGIILTGALVVAAMSDPALRRADDPNDLFN